MAKWTVSTVYGIIYRDKLDLGDYFEFTNWHRGIGECGEEYAF